MFGFNVGNQTYYLSVVNSQLGVSTTECTWYIEDGHYYTLLDGIALYIVFENNEWHLTPADGVMLSVNSMHLNVQNSVYNADGGTIWQFSSLTGDTQISCVYNNAKYYLTCEDGVVKVTTTPTTWHRNGEALYITIGEKDYYLTYDSGWKATALDYYLIHDATSTNYLVVSGTQSFTNTTNSAEATHFYFSNTSGDHPYGSLSCIFNGNVQYLQIYFDTVNRIGMLQLESQPTPFSNDGTSLYYAGSGVSYYLEYEGDWHIRTYMDGYYISDGKDYMTVSGTTVGNTTNKYNATIFTFSSTGTNPSGYVSVCGTNNYLRYYSGSLRVTNDTTSNRTSLNNDGNNLNYSSRYLTCINGTWGFNTSTNCSAYTIQRDGYYLCCSTTGQIYTSTTDKTYWSGVSGRIRDRSTGYYLCFNNFSGELGNLITSTSSSATNGNWSSTDGSNGGKIIYIINSTQAKAFAVDLRDGQFYVSATAQGDSGYTVPSTTVVTPTSTRCPSKAIKTSNDIVAVGQTEYEVPMPTVYVENYSMTNNFHISDPKPIEYNLNFFNTRLQNCEKEIRNNVKSGNPTYFPLRVDKDESGNYPSGYAVSEKNTGYLISGANLETSSTVTSGQDTVGDIRVAGWPVSNISASYNSTSKAFTKIYTVDGTSSNTIRELTTAEKQDAGYVEALSQFGATLSQSGGKVYGVHFMDAAISTSHTVRANQATILGKTYYNYELPEDSIDFNVYQKGKISFFAGEYFTNNNTFFSLHRIFRDANNDIDQIKEIVEIYDHAQKHDKANYIYKFSDGTYTNANGSYTGSRTKDSMYSTNPVFKTSWITNPSGLSTNSKRLFYFSIPCNAGEYALGSVSGKNGAYLCYLDIATNGGDTKLEEMKTTETATTFNVDYRSPDVVTNHSTLQVGGEIPAAVNPEDFSITVNFDNSAETCDGKEYASGIYTIYVVNKTDEEFELCVLVIDDNDDLYDDFYYAYRVIYTNKDNTEEIIMCTPLNDPGGDAKDYWQRLAIFEIPPDGEAHESDYTE